MIVIDVAEKPELFNTFDKLGIPYKKEEIRIPKKCDKIPIRAEDGKLRCIEQVDFEYLLDNEIDVHMKELDNIACTTCTNLSERVGDFTNDHKSFIIERKRVDDYYMSMADGRLYEQARKIYKWCSGIKAVILEGMAHHDFISDAVFEDFDNQEMELKMLSPIDQLIKMHPDKEPWIWESIEDLASCEVVIIPSKSLEETAKIVQRISEGSGIEPKIRAIPKKIPGLSLEEKMLTVVPGIGKVRAQNLIAEFGSFGKLITDVRKMPKKEAEKKTITKILKELFT